MNHDTSNNLQSENYYENTVFPQIKEGKTVLNWRAAFSLYLWLAYKGIWRQTFFLVFITVVFDVIRKIIVHNDFRAGIISSSQLSSIINLILVLLMFIYMLLYANKILYNHTQKKRPVKNKISYVTAIIALLFVTNIGIYFYFEKIRIKEIKGQDYSINFDKTYKLTDMLRLEKHFEKLNYQKFLLFLLTEGNKKIGRLVINLDYLRNEASELGKEISQFSILSKFPSHFFNDDFELYFIDTDPKNDLKIYPSSTYRYLLGKYTIYNMEKVELIFTKTISRYSIDSVVKIVNNSTEFKTQSNQLIFVKSIDGVSLLYAVKPDSSHEEIQQSKKFYYDSFAPEFSEKLNIEVVDKNYNIIRK